MGNQGKVMEALRILQDYKREGGDLCQVGPLSALTKLEEAFKEQDTPTLPTYEMVKGSDLKVGDTVIILASVTDRRNPMTDKVVSTGGHVHINGHRGVPSPWRVGDQYLWTWGDEPGSGINNEPDIMRATW